jgi:hypothetical protein
MAWSIERSATLARIIGSPSKTAQVDGLNQLDAELKVLEREAKAGDGRDYALYERACAVRRRIVVTNPAVETDRIVIVAGGYHNNVDAFGQAETRSGLFPHHRRSVWRLGRTVDKDLRDPNSPELAHQYAKVLNELMSPRRIPIWVRISGRTSHHQTSRQIRERDEELAGW